MVACPYGTELALRPNELRCTRNLSGNLTLSNKHSHCSMQRILEYLKQNQSRFIDELCEYVRFPSVSAQAQHRQDLHACAEWVVRQCHQIGLDARLCPTQGHPIVVAKTPRLGAQATLPASRNG